MTDNIVGCSRGPDRCDVASLQYRNTDPRIPPPGTHSGRSSSSGGGGISVPKRGAVTMAEEEEESAEFREEMMRKRLAKFGVRTTLWSGLLRCRPLCEPLPPAAAACLCTLPPFTRAMQPAPPCQSQPRPGSYNPTIRAGTAAPCWPSHRGNEIRTLLMLTHAGFLSRTGFSKLLGVCVARPAAPVC